VLGTTLIFWEQSGQTDHLAFIHLSPDLRYQTNPALQVRRQSHERDIGERKRANGRQGPIDIPHTTVGTIDSYPMGAL
jgi:hypothetical protein